MCVSDLWTLWETNLPHNLHPLAQSYLVQFPGLSVTATNSRRTTKKRERERETERQRERERATFEPWSLMSLLTRFGDGGKSSIRKIVSLFFLPLSLPMPPLSHTHLLIQRIPSSITQSALLSFWLSLQHTLPRITGTLAFQEAVLRNVITLPLKLCCILAAFSEIYDSLFYCLSMQKMS